MTVYPVMAQFADVDTRASLALNRCANQRWWCNFFRLISRMGDGPLWYISILGMGLLGSEDTRLLALLMAIVGILNTVVYKTIKLSLKRSRPFARHPAIIAYAKPLDEFSFPSGHTMHAVAFGILLIVHFPVLTPVMLVFMLLTALSRITLGLHYVSDVCMGAVLGCITAQWLPMLLGQL